MKVLFERWRRLSYLSERINTLDPDTGKRFISAELMEISEEDHSIPIPAEELEEIRQWAGLSGEPNFLGSGTKGSAYRFGDRVLKITNDANEAKAAKKIAGKAHPNVYSIYGVARRSDENLKNSQKGFERRPYVIVYEFLDYPTRGMVEATRHIHDAVKAKGARSPFYFWNETNLDEARALLRRLVVKSKSDPSVLGEPMSKWGNALKKVEEIAANMGWSPEETMKFATFFAGGLESLTPDQITPEGLAQYYSENKNNPLHQYLHQLALGLTFLRENGIIFNDLKGSNVMEKGDQVAIIDIGWSTVQGEEQIPLL